MPSTLTPHIEKALLDIKAAQMDLSMRFEAKLRGVVADAKQTIMCSPGCAHCCHYPVTVSVLEGVNIYRHLTHRGVWTPSFRARIQAHADQTFGLAYEVWLLSMIPCPLLDAKSKCSIYPARPFSCRVTYSTGDPHLCHPHRLVDNGSVVSRVSVLAEFYEVEQRAFRANGAHQVLIPLSKALLVAEKLLTGGLPFDGLDRFMATELETHL